MTIEELKSIIAEKIEVHEVVKKHSEDIGNIPNAHYYSGKLKAYLELMKLIEEV